MMAEKMSKIAKATNVSIRYYINKISSISDSSQTFDVDMYLELRWEDPRILAQQLDVDNEDFLSGKVWVPQLDIVNVVDYKTESEHYYVQGNLVVRWVRLKATISSAMDFSDFPFDVQVLSIRFESSDHESEMLEFSNSSDKDGARVGAHVKKMNRNGEWEFTDLHTHTGTFVWEYDHSRYSFYQIDITLSRQTGFYLKKIGVIVALIWMMNWSVFFCDIDDIGNRLQVSITLALTSVAFQFVIVESLPRVSYNTSLDSYFSMCFIVIASSVLESCVVYRLSKLPGWEIQKLEQVEDILLVVSMVFFVTFTWWTFTLARKHKSPALCVANSLDRMRNGHIGYQTF